MRISQLTDSLFVGAQPSAEDYARLRDLGVTLVISMRGEEAPPKRALDSIESLWLRTYDTPFTPIPLDTLQRGAQAALATMERGGRVLVHCNAGRHRSVALAAAILIAQGYTADAAMEVIVRRHPPADPRRWYIRQRIERFERLWWAGGYPPFDPSRVRALLFDLDGTLANTDDAYIRRAAHWLRPVAFLFPRRDPAPFLRLIFNVTENPASFVMTIPDRLGLDDELEVVKGYLRRVRGVRGPKRFLLVDGVGMMLERVSKRYPLALVTSRTEREARAFLDQFNLGGCFRAVVAAFSAPRLKPHPAPVREAARQLGVPVEECVMIGDTTVDIEAGRRAGAQTIGVLCGFGEREELEKSGASLILETAAEVGKW